MKFTETSEQKEGQKGDDVWLKPGGLQMTDVHTGEIGDMLCHTCVNRTHCRGIFEASLRGTIHITRVKLAYFTVEQCFNYEKAHYDQSKDIK